VRIPEREGERGRERERERFFLKTPDDEACGSAGGTTAGRAVAASL
jgi:hypothetical protein